MEPLHRPDGAPPALIAELDHADRAFNTALKAVRVNNPARAPGREPGPDVGGGVWAVAMAVREYRFAGEALQRRFSELLRKNRRVESFTKQIPPMVEKARRRLRKEAESLDKDLRNYETVMAMLAIDVARRLEDARIRRSVKDAMSQVQKILLDTTKELWNLADQVDREHPAPPRSR